MLACDLTCIQDMGQDSDYTQLTVFAGLLQNVLTEDLRETFRHECCTHIHRILYCTNSNGSVSVHFWCKEYCWFNLIFVYFTAPWQSINIILSADVSLPRYTSIHDYMIDTDLHQLRSRSVVRKQIQSLLDDVSTGTTSLVVLRLLTFAENLDGGKSTDLNRRNFSLNKQIWGVSFIFLPYLGGVK